jgi:hypothetical protein
MKKVIKLTFLLFLVIITSCEEKGMIVNCEDCVQDEPFTAVIEIKIDIGYYGAAPDITIYEGNLEDGVILRHLQPSGTITKASVTLNKKYTFTADYYFPPNNYMTVDSATPRVVYNKDQCNDPCYYVYDKVVDLRVRYQK